MRRQGRVTTAFSVGCATLALLTGCAPWLAADPHFASDSARNPGAGPATSSAVAGGPSEWAAPKNDLAWKDCTAKEFGDSGVKPLPGVSLDCANYDADLDPVGGADAHTHVATGREQGGAIGLEPGQGQQYGPVAGQGRIVVHRGEPVLHRVEMVVLKPDEHLDRPLP